MPLPAKVKRGIVVSMTEKSATLDSGEVLEFDYAALCHGAAYSDSFGKTKRAVTREERLQELETIRADIAKAKNIVVVGGGPAGVEVAAEIVEAYAGKQVSIVTPASTLLHGKVPKITNHAQKWLEAHKVGVLLGERASVAEDADPSHPGTVTLSSGKQLTADLVFWCTGSRVTSDHLKPALANAVDEQGRVKVNEFLQLKGYPHIFAIGDCHDFPEPAKLGYLAGEQAKLVAASLQALIKGKANGLKAYKPPEAMFVSLGRGDGAGHFGGCACTGFMVKNAKSKNLFVDKSRAQFKVKK